MKKKGKHRASSAGASSESRGPTSTIRLKMDENRRSYGLQETVAVACPFCGQVEDIPIDEGGGEHQEFVEDCSVCCRPRIVHLDVSPETGGEPQVWVERTA